jgi:hypothetical protein
MSHIVPQSCDANKDYRMKSPLNLILLAIVIGGAGCATSTSPANDTAVPKTLVPGTSYYGRANYVEYIAGNMPLIFTAPHGGQLLPDEIPDRTPTACGGTATTVRDSNTGELVRAIQAAFLAHTGKYPHIVIAHLSRRKLDANRPRSEAACGDAEAGVAFDQYHAFIDAAKSKIIADFGKGWYTDVHGHGHPQNRLELGYLLGSSDLALGDAALDASASLETGSSIGTLSLQSALSFSGLLRGPTSLGTLFANAGYAAIPSVQQPAPGQGEAFFSGGYSTERHGCANGGPICGVQIEHHMTNVRDTEANRAAYAAALVNVYETFLAQNLGITLGRR